MILSGTIWLFLSVYILGVERNGRIGGMNMLPAEKKIQKLIAENKIPAGAKKIFILSPY